jgi:ABC-type multidrug transport system fused ATPase/permease subunit
MNDNEDIRKKEKKLDRNHWMCRIQKYTFGIDAPTYYMGYCPFFWMTWLAVIWFPFAVIGKFLNKIFSGIFDSANEKTKSYREYCREKRENTPLEPTFKDFVRLGKYDEDDSYYSGVSYIFKTLDYGTENSKRIHKWLQLNPDWKTTHLPKAQEQYDHWLAEEEKQRQLEKIREERFEKLKSSMVRYTSLCGKAIFKLIIPLLIIAAAIGVIFVAGWIVSKITLLTILGIFTVVMFFLAGYLAGKIIGDFLKTFVFIERNFNKIDKFRGVLVKIGRFFKNTWIFISDTVKLTYKAECPLIIWGEETGKIEKRNKN